MARTLLIPKTVFREIVGMVFETGDGIETGVTLFGVHLERLAGSRYVVLAVAGPGRRATHEPAHYSGDEKHASDIFAALGCALPGIRWLGELHVHPKGMIWLSAGDLRTVGHILTESDPAVRPEEFLAGVMQRRNRTVDIYPFHFTRERRKGKAMGIRIVDSGHPVVRQARLKAVEEGDGNDRSGICTQSRGSRAAVAQAPGHHWLREWRKRAGRHGFASWHR